MKAVIMRFAVKWTLGVIAAVGLAASCGGNVSKPADGSMSSEEEQDKPDSQTKPSKGAGTDKDPGKSQPGDSGDNKDPGGEKDPGDPSGDDGPKFDLEIPDAPESSEIGCNIDFLFVVDNSRSMTDNQKSLTNSVPDFVETMTKQIKNLEEYHIGVISTDFNQRNKTDEVKGCNQLGGLMIRRVDYTPGSEMPWDETCIPYANGKNFITDDDEVGEKFSCAARIGQMGDGNEVPMDAIKAAMSEKMTAKGACNEGFFREKAILVIVLVSDEEDDHEVEDGRMNGSKGDPPDWYKTVMDFKKNESEYVVMLSLIGKPEPNECDYTYEPGQEPKDGKGIKSAEVSRRLIEFTESFGKRGVVGDVCAPNYDGFFKKALSVLDLACSELPG